MKEFMEYNELFLSLGNALPLNYLDWLFQLVNN